MVHLAQVTTENRVHGYIHPLGTIILSNRDPSVSFVIRLQGRLAPAVVFVSHTLGTRTRTGTCEVSAAVESV
jgi:hypothetical protein